MRKKISFVILSSSGAPAKQVCTSKTAIHLFGAVLIAIFLVVGYIIYDYYNLRETTAHLQNREVYLSSRMDEIHLQRKQIQKFASEINALKSKLLALSGFEKKIRIIANLEDANESDNIFGVGGSIPDDLDAQLPLTEKHNSLMRDMHEQIEQLSRASGSQQEEFESLLRSLEDQQNLLASTPAIRPISRSVKSWTPILATADGVVTFSGKKGLLGYTIVIDHGHGMVTRYGHNHKLLRKRGDKVKRWETIALMGSTGRSTGPHVHYEVHLNGIPVNPEKYMLN
ncbi:MAG: peptidoglycan DD-metalloendopeptidase family protein [Deltaproteobacteria bacterium]|nr:peptidoglycan DD-metalloendopeptidase family protein [Deltaproteobacteria bacterium]